MRRIKERLITFAMLLVLCLSLPLTVQAGEDTDGYTEYTDSGSGYTAILYDEADVLSSRNEEKIMENLQKITPYGNAIFYSAVANGYADDDEARRTAMDFYESCFSRTSDGVIVAIVLDDDGQGGCMLWIQAYNGMEDRVSASLCTDIADNATSKHRGDGIPAKYFGYADESCMQIRRVLAGTDIPRPMKVVTSALLALILGLLINFLIVAEFNRKKNAGAREVLAGLVSQFQLSETRFTLTHTDRRYSPQSSSSGGSGGGGGGGGGGHSGGGGHRG